MKLIIIIIIIYLFILKISIFFGRYYWNQTTVIDVRSDVTAHSWNWNWLETKWRRCSTGQVECTINALNGKWKWIIHVDGNRNSDKRQVKRLQIWNNSTEIFKKFTIKINFNSGEWLIIIKFFSLFVHLKWNSIWPLKYVRLDAFT